MEWRKDRENAGEDLRGTAQLPRTGTEGRGGCRRSPWLAKAGRCWSSVEDSAHAQGSNRCRDRKWGQAVLTGSKNLRSCYYGVGNQGVMLGT